ncbi:MAG TPA: helix-turn-helix domain-containing protein, partial [Vicinamibacterales bacterium]|nr:helix-turn-helix domain-containing protein [Vicinamibacterales bacterium]
AATNRDLRAAVGARRFREDLFFRLSVFPITVPALRDRREDILLLATHFLRRFASEMNKEAMSLSADAAEVLCGYGWPGNVRELQNCVERSVILADGPVIEVRHLNVSHAAPLPQAPLDPWDAVDLSGSWDDVSRRVLAEAERRVIRRALQQAGGDAGRASEALGVPYRLLRAKMKERGV